MGTSKGYIPPTKPEWSNAKRAVSGFLRNRDSDSRTNAIQKFGEAMNSSAAVGSTSFASAAGNVIAFAQDIRKYGLEHGLVNFGRSDLIGKSSDEILQELLYQFTNDSASIEDSLAADSLSQALENLQIDSVEQLGSVDLDILLKEMVISFVLISFSSSLFNFSGIFSRALSSLVMLPSALVPSSPECFAAPFRLKLCSLVKKL